MKPKYRSFKIDISNGENIKNFIEYVSEKYPFKDSYGAKFPIKMKKHYHEGPEARLFISGTATFVLDDQEIKCEPGVYIEIDPGLPHSFYSDGPFTALRFNTKYEEWRTVELE